MKRGTRNSSPQVRLRASAEVADEPAIFVVKERPASDWMLVLPWVRLLPALVAGDPAKQDAMPVPPRDR